MIAVERAAVNAGTSFAQVAQARLAGLRPSEQRVVEHLLALDPSAPAATTAAVANALGVSQATVVNTVQRLGYAGFADFRRQRIAELAVERFQAASRQEPDPPAADELAAVRQRVLTEDVAAIEATARRLDAAAFRMAAEALAAAPQILCIGAELSGVMARLAAGTLTKYGLRAAAEEHTSEQLALVEVADPLLVLLVISYRGINRQLAEVVRRARERRMTVVGLTNSPGSALARTASITLFTAGPTLPDGLHPNKTGGRAAQFFVLRALAEAVAQLREEADPHQIT